MNAYNYNNKGKGLKINEHVDISKNKSALKDEMCNVLILALKCFKVLEESELQHSSFSSIY